VRNLEEQRKISGQSLFRADNLIYSRKSEAELLQPPHTVKLEFNQ